MKTPSQATPIRSPMGPGFDQVIRAVFLRAIGHQPPNHWVHHLFVSLPPLPSSFFIFPSPLVFRHPPRLGCNSLATKPVHPV